VPCYLVEALAHLRQKGAWLASVRRLQELTLVTAELDGSILCEASVEGVVEEDVYES